jgi:hypothetical protein
MTQADIRNSLGEVLIALYKGVVYQERDSSRWQDLIDLQSGIQDHISVIGMQLIVDEAEGYAYLQQRPAEEGIAELPRLVQRRQLAYSVSLLLALLRKKLAEHDATDGDPRLILSREQILELARVFLADSANEAKLVDRLDSQINKVVELGFLRKLRDQQGQFEVRRIIKAYVDAQWLAELDQRLDSYQQYATKDQ